MSSVTERIKKINQPYGGYIKPSSMVITELNDGKFLNETENVSPSIIGMVVDYMTRFMMGANISDAFKISILGSEVAEKLSAKSAKKEIKNYLKEIKGLDDKSIINACKATTFDIWYRNPAKARMAKGAAETNPDSNTVANIRILIERSLCFWEKYGPIKVEGFTFEKKGYTKTVNTGDGDFLTQCGTSKFQSMALTVNIHYNY